jgi:MYXO-CTERM domain-containing protein
VGPGCPSSLRASDGLRYSRPVKNRAQTSLCRLGLAIPLALGIMGGATLAGANTRSLPLDSNFPGTPAAGNAAGSMAGNVSDDVAGGKIDDAGQSLCTWETCGPQRADSPWTLAGFGLAAGAMAWLGRRPRQ